jgi:hypothetical protein
MSETDSSKCDLGKIVPSFKPGIWRSVAKKRFAFSRASLVSVLTLLAVLMVAILLLLLLPLLLLLLRWERRTCNRARARASGCGETKHGVELCLGAILRGEGSVGTVVVQGLCMSLINCRCAWAMNWMKQVEMMAEQFLIYTHIRTAELMSYPKNTDQPSRLVKFMDGYTILHTAGMELRCCLPDTIRTLPSLTHPGCWALRHRAMAPSNYRLDATDLVPKLYQT